MTEMEDQQYESGPVMEDMPPSNHLESDQGETEDEEVKRNCVMGQSGLHDSDFSESEMENEDEVEEEEEDDDDNDNDGEEEEQDHLVKFVCGGQIPKPEGMIYRPTPIVPKLPTHLEESEEDSSSDSEESRSVNERGAAFSFTDSNDEPDEETSDDEDENEEDDDGDEDGSVVDQDDEEQVDTLNASLEDHTAGGNGNDDEDDEVDYAAVELAVDEPSTTMEVDDDPVKKDLPDQEEDNYALVGASGASVDEKWTWSKQKRVLSSNTLAALNREAGRNADSPKRMRSFLPAEPSAMPELSLGIAALDQIQPLPRPYLMRDHSPIASSDEEEDKMLSEELEEKNRDSGGDNSPIPLLTPPQSPRREEEEVLASVEWPSNLVVDSALMNSISTEVRPLSPASLQNLEEEEEQRLKNNEIEPSSLTPLLRSIYVGTV